MELVSSLAHTKANCKHHLGFAPKYCRRVFFGEKRVEIGPILRRLCEWKNVNIAETEVCKDHVHMLVEIPPKISVSGFMGISKVKISSERSLYLTFSSLSLFSILDFLFLFKINATDLQAAFETELQKAETCC